MACWLIAFSAAPSLCIAEPYPPVKHIYRFDEDYSYLADPARRTHILDPLKYIPLGRNEDVYLSLGGEARLKYEYYSRPILSASPADSSGFLLTRFLIHADLHATEYFRAFAQFQSELLTAKEGGPRATDANDFDLHQAFVDVRLPLDAATITARTGRQEMAYGTERLISVRNGPNIRLSFDAVRLITEGKTWRVDAFLSRPVVNEPGAFDDEQSRSTALWGLYATVPVLPEILKADIYYLGNYNEAAAYNRGVGKEVRHSLGTRLFGGTSGWDYNWEGVIQFGTFDGTSILAWTLGTETGYTFYGVAGKPRLFLRADIISGDSGSGSLGTFNPLFPKGIYFNAAILYGPLNLIDVQPGIDISLSKTVRFTASCDFVWRYTRSDGLYSNASTLIIPADAGEALFIGVAPSVLISWQINRYLSAIATWVPFIPGPYVIEAGQGSQLAHYVGAWLTFWF